MDILSNLTELIKTRKEVGISGLGTIYKKKSPGKYDVETHSFLPPSYALHFTSEVHEQTSLAEFISKRENISYDSAGYFVDQFAEHLKKQLEDGQEADLGELGKLSVTPDGLVFSPLNKTVFGFDFYGLPTLKDEITSTENELPEVSDEQLDLEDHNADLSDGSSEMPDEINENPEFIQDSPGSDHADMINSDEPQYIVEAYEEQDNKIMPAYVKVIIAGAIILGILAALYFIKPELLNNYINNKPETEALKTTAEINQMQIDSVKKADSVKNAVNTVNLQTDSLKDSLSAVPQVLADTVTTWEVIGASIINQKEVDRFISQMKAIGITAKVIPTIPGKRRIKISVGTFYDEASARTGRKKLVVKLKNPDLYIYQNKHTHKP